MSKITKKQLHNGWHGHDTEIIKMKKELRELKQSVLRLEKLTDEKPLDEPQLKQLDQSAFDHPYVDDRFKYVALNADSQAVFFESKPVISNCLDIWVVHTGSIMPMLKGYDASNWQNSLIERDTAKELLEVDLSSELTGSDLCRAMLARGDKYVMCLVSDSSQEDTLLDGYSAAISSITYKERFYGYDFTWLYATPINNQGEPLTASEVGL